MPLVIRSKMLEARSKKARARLSILEHARTRSFTVPWYSSSIEARKKSARPTTIFRLFCFLFKPDQIFILFLSFSVFFARYFQNRKLTELVLFWFNARQQNKGWFSKESSLNMFYLHFDILKRKQNTLAQTLFVPPCVPVLSRIWDLSNGFSFHEEEKRKQPFLGCRLSSQYRRSKPNQLSFRMATQQHKEQCNSVSTIEWGGEGRRQSVST